MKKLVFYIPRVLKPSLTSVMAKHLNVMQFSFLIPNSKCSILSRTDYFCGAVMFLFFLVLICSIWVWKKMRVSK